MTKIVLPRKRAPNIAGSRCVRTDLMEDIPKCARFNRSNTRSSQTPLVWALPLIVLADRVLDRNHDLAGCDRSKHPIGVKDSGS